MSFSLLDLLLFAGITQGIFLAFSLQFITKKNKKANKILTIIIILATFMFATKMPIRETGFEFLWRIVWLTECSIYLFGPLLYLYFKALVFKDNPKNRLPLIHYIPSIILVLYFCWSLFYTKEKYTSMSNSYLFFYIYLVMESLGSISLCLYAILCYKIGLKIKHSDQEESIYRKKIMRYIQFTSIGTFCMSIFWAIAIYIGYIMRSHSSYFSYQLVWISMAVLLFIVGYFSFTQPEIVRLPIEKKISSKDRLTKEEIEIITKKLQQLINDEQVFINSSLSLKILAQKLDTSANNVSWLLNSIYGKTFYEYINEHRIKAFLKKVENGEHKQQTILAVAMDSGFNSKSTFNKSFKAMMNETPSRYIEKMYS